MSLIMVVDNILINVSASLAKTLLIINNDRTVLFKALTVQINNRKTGIVTVGHLVSKPVPCENIPAEHYENEISSNVLWWTDFPIVNLKAYENKVVRQHSWQY